MSEESDDEERFKNIVLYHFWGTDAEFEEAAPAICIGVVVAIIVGILIVVLRG